MYGSQYSEEGELLHPCDSQTDSVNRFSNFECSQDLADENSQWDAVTQSPREASDAEPAETNIGKFSKERSAKDELVARLLCRWWYVLPDWPPKDFDYTLELERRKLKAYHITEFEEAENVDFRGYTKVYQIKAFPGVYRDFSGKAHDLRPMEGRPCFNNLCKLSEAELLRLVTAAIERQLEILKASPHDESATIAQLHSELENLQQGFS